MHFLIAGDVPAADSHAQLGGCRSGKRAGTELCWEPHLRPSLLGFQLQTPSLMCNSIYLFIFLLLDAKLLTEHPHTQTSTAETGQREGVLSVCLCDGSGHRGRRMP